MDEHFVIAMSLPNALHHMDIGMQLMANDICDFNP